ncbi:MAG: LysR family transcriptional regulator [Pseudomonadota bacterium]
MAHTPERFTLWGIEVFLATVEEASISVAARRLKASPATVSQQLTNLETALGVVLLDRSSRPVLPTPAGEIFRVRAQAIINEAQQARAELGMADLSALSSFRFGVIEDFDADVTPKLLQRLAGQLKASRFLLETGASHRLFDQLETRALDMIVAADLDEGADWLEVHPIVREPFVAAVPRAAKLGPRPSMQSLRALPLIQYTERHLMGRVIAAHLAREGLRLERRFELDSYHAILAMVAEGVGWSILTPLGWRRAERFVDAVDIVPLPCAPLERRISLMARAGLLQNMPRDTAESLRDIVQSEIVGPTTQEHPWMQGRLKVLAANELT